MNLEQYESIIQLSSYTDALINIPQIATKNIFEFLIENTSTSFLNIPRNNFPKNFVLYIKTHSKSYRCLISIQNMYNKYPQNG